MTVNANAPVAVLDRPAAITDQEYRQAVGTVGLLDAVASINELRALVEGARTPELRPELEARYGDDLPKVVAHSSAKAHNLGAALRPTFIAIYGGPELVAAPNNKIPKPLLDEWRDFNARYVGRGRRQVRARETYRKTLAGRIAAYESVEHTAA